ncbi:MAG: response regulator [Actinomycetota bacterium]|nr:response regulator [Actinomycetota bacterium]
MPEKKKVLIVEDDEEIVKLLNLRLRTEGFETVSATDAKSGVSLASEYQPDLILLDIALPDESGAEFMKRMELSEQTKNIPVIVITAYPSKVRLTEGFSTVRESFIKPFELPKLIATMRSVLAESS